MSDLDDLFTSSPRPKGSAQCPKCSKFARILDGGQDNTPDSCDYWFLVDCKTCGVQRG